MGASAEAIGRFTRLAAGLGVVVALGASACGSNVPERSATTTDAFEIPEPTPAQAARNDCRAELAQKFERTQNNIIMSWEAKQEELTSFGVDDPRSELLLDVQNTYLFDVSQYGRTEGQALSSALTTIDDFCVRHAVELGY